MDKIALSAKRVATDRAEDCPEKHNGGSPSLKICLKCGVSGHDMFSCWNDYYSPDDLMVCLLDRSNEKFIYLFISFFHTFFCYLLEVYIILYIYINLNKDCLNSRILVP
jgi:hypothetical protein